MFAAATVIVRGNESSGMIFQGEKLSGKIDEAFMFVGIPKSRQLRVMLFPCFLIFMDFVRNL